jgi:hypothetical protein
MTHNQPPMKLPQISLRELFLLVALIAMGCGWWVEHHRLTAEVQALQLRAIFAEAREYARTRGKNR